MNAKISDHNGGIIAEDAVDLDLDGWRDSGMKSKAGRNGKKRKKDRMASRVAGLERNVLYYFGGIVRAQRAKNN